MFVDTTPFIISLFVLFTFLIGIAFWNRLNSPNDEDTNAKNTSNKSEKEDTSSKQKQSSNENQKNKNYNHQQKSNNKDDLFFFGLNENYTFEELKTARMKKLKENHPDKVNEMSEEIKNIAKVQTQRINDTFIKLQKKFKN
jgi:hypothetical protein